MFYVSTYVETQTHEICLLAVKHNGYTLRFMKKILKILIVLRMSLV